MSLIHDALKSMDAPQDSKLVLARAPATAARSRPAWLDAMLAFVIVVGAGLVGWFMWQSQTRPRVDLTPAAVAPVRPVTQPMASTAPTAVPAEPSLTVAAVPAAQVPAAVAVVADAPASPPAAQATAPVTVAMQPAATAAPAPAFATPRAAVPALAVEARTPNASVAQATVPRPAPQRQARATARPVDQAAPVPAAAAAVDDTPVELRFARFVTAMKEGRGADAERELGALKEGLPAGSLGLLRAQAWYDLRAGRDAAAAAGYRAITERMPGDEEAAINLASIQARQQKPEEARATLDAALRLQPDSAALRAALAQFTPAAR